MTSPSSTSTSTTRLLVSSRTDALLRTTFAIWTPKSVKRLIYETKRRQSSRIVSLTLDLYARALCRTPVEDLEQPVLQEAMLMPALLSLWPVLGAVHSLQAFDHVVKSVALMSTALHRARPIAALRSILSWLKRMSGPQFRSSTRYYITRNRSRPC